MSIELDRGLWISEGALEAKIPHVSIRTYIHIQSPTASTKIC